jgi:hypothetical protein
MVIVDMGVTIGIDGYVKQTMFGKQGEHMIEEADAGMGVTKPGTVDVQRQGDGSFAGGTGNRGVARGHDRLLIPANSGSLFIEKTQGAGVTTGI